MDSRQTSYAATGPGTESLRTPHTFHIPVMGTGFTVDTPARVARYGISSVVSIGDDILLEHMREELSREFGRDFASIGDREIDSRAARITAYLNLLGSIVEEQTEHLRAEAFEPGSDICRYFELIPESPAKRDYRRMMTCTDRATRTALQDVLRGCIVPGSIDVNIMTKVDGPVLRTGIPQTPDQTVAVSALRGYAKSNLRSSIVFSAGLNRRLFASLDSYPDFFADANGHIIKKIVLKVSDVRSAVVQGKLLASRGIWVSEFRLESGLNCGGHAFPTVGNLMGPILEDFRTQRHDILDQLFAGLSKALKAAGRPVPAEPPETRITAQGGIGTSDEAEFLRRYYQLDSTGWGTPFLLVPEVTNIDDQLLPRLAAATAADVFLSDASPLGVPFWNLRNSASEMARRDRIQKGKPGSSCPKGYLRLNTDYSGQPLCTASAIYQKRKLRDLSTGDMTQEQREALSRQALAKACICHELSGGAAVKRGFDPLMQSAVCPGPGIVDYSRIASLEEMVDHIYGRFSLITNQERPHMFVRELMLYIDYLKAEIGRFVSGLSERSVAYFPEFRSNLEAGIDYYRKLVSKLNWESQERFLADLEALSDRLTVLFGDFVAATGPEQDNCAAAQG